jgi:Flp pilus assembly protein TadG
MTRGVQSVEDSRARVRARSLKDRVRAERGTALVEMAIVLPILLLLIMGIFYFSLFMNYSDNATHLASEAARFAAVNSNPGSAAGQSLDQYVLSQAPGGLTSANSDVTSPAQVYIYFPSGSSGNAGDAVRACVTATVQFMPIFGSLTSARITQTATMRMEQDATWTPDTPPAQCPMS